jgi:uncharacterized cupredoxin-like copper-binding protein
VNGSYQILIFVGLSFGWFSLFVWKRRSRIEHMHAMMISMSMGMMIGLIAGLIFGVEYQGDLYTSTILGMGAGGILGLIIGIPLSILCSVEGTLSGVMAGSMGAMLGEMIPANKMEPLLFIFVMLYLVCVLLLSKYMETDEKEKARSRWLRTLHNPITPPVLLVGVFIWFQSLPFSLASTDPNQMHSHHQTPTPIMQEINLKAEDFAYQPSQIVMKKGVPTKVTFQNNGKVEHDFQIVAKENFLVHSESSPHHQHGNEEAGKPHLHAKPGESVTGVWEATKTGTFEFYCTIPGHKESGMVGSLVVI